MATFVAFNISLVLLAASLAAEVRVASIKEKKFRNVTAKLVYL